MATKLLKSNISNLQKSSFPKSKSPLLNLLFFHGGKTSIFRLFIFQVWGVKTQETRGPFPVGHNREPLQPNHGGHCASTACLPNVGIQGGRLGVAYRVLQGSGDVFLDVWQITLPKTNPLKNGGVLKLLTFLGGWPTVSSGDFAWFQGEQYVFTPG